MDDRAGTRTNSQRLSPKLDLSLLMKLCYEIAGKWRSIGIQLGVPCNQLDIIQANNCGGPHMVQNCLSCMFDWWLKNEQDVTPEKLAQAIHTVDEHRLEIEVKKTFCLSLEPCCDIDFGHHLAESDLPDYVQKYCRDTKKRYVQQSVLPESDWPPTLGGQYIRLALVKQGRTMRDFAHHAVIELQKDYVRGEYDKILEHKTGIKLEQIFDPLFCGGGYEIPLKMLIDGAPGVGKTTLSRKVSQKWANGELLQGYWLVLLLHLRERNISKTQMIDNFFYHDDQMVQNATVNFVKKTSGKGVLVIFDGFDELSLTQRREQSLFLDIIKGKVLSECAVVVTSRPYASRPVQELQSVNRHIEVLGFTSEQIHMCIKQRISDEAKAKELCAELKDRLDIASICQIPLNCSIVLYVYELEDYRLPDTLTELYELFILHCLRRYATRNSVTETLHDIHKLPRLILNHFSVLSKVAYDGLNEDKLVFEQWDLELAFSQAFSGTDLPVLDLMTSAKSYSSRGPHVTYSFLHLIIQEYLGAFWAARNLSEREKLNFLRQNLTNERFYMVLWFFAGITKLKISNVQTIFNNALWEYNNHVHICHLLYESDSKSHSLCNYVANSCILKKEIKFIYEDKEGSVYGTWKYPCDFKLTSNRRGSKYSRFDCLMIAHFLAHSSCQWNSLILNVDDVQVFHRVFNGLESCCMTIEQVIIEVHQLSISKFHEETMRLLDEIPTFEHVHLSIKLAGVSKNTCQTIKGNLKNVLMKTKAINSICMEIIGSNKDDATKFFYDELIAGIAHSCSLVSQVELQSVTVEAIEYLISMLIKWNSNLKLATLSVSKNKIRYCYEEKRCYEFCNSLSTFLSKNASLRKLKLLLPFIDHHLISCIDSIQSGLDQNFTLEKLIISDQIVFERNKRTSKLELVQGHKLLNSQSGQTAINNEQDDTNHPITSEGISSVLITPFGSSTIQTQCRITPSHDSESPCMNDGIHSFQAPPAKRMKGVNSNEENQCQTCQVHVKPQPVQPQLPAAFFGSPLPTSLYSPSCTPSQFITTKPHLQPHYFMPGSSSTQGTHDSHRHYQPQEHVSQYHSTWNHSPHYGFGVTCNSPLMRPTVMQHPTMPHQQPTNDVLSRSYNGYSLFNWPSNVSHPRLHAGMDSRQNNMLLDSAAISSSMRPPIVPPRLPPTADHTMHHFTSEPEQYLPPTAPPIQTVYYPSTQTPSTTSVNVHVHVGHSSFPLPTTSTHQ